MTKTAFITGVTAGIGAAAARKFVSNGWQVVGTGRRRDRRRRSPTNGARNGSSTSPDWTRMSFAPEPAIGACWRPPWPSSKPMSLTSLPWLKLLESNQKC